MLKRTITYTDFNGDTVTEDHFFNLSKAELLEMELVGELGDQLRQMVKAENMGALFLEIKKFILLSYGRKSADGKNFFKKDPITGARYAEEFVQSAAYDKLLVDFLGNNDEAALFIMGILPKDIVVEVERAIAANPGTPPSQVFMETVRPAPAVSTMPPPPPQA